MNKKKKSTLRTVLPVLLGIIGLGVVFVLASYFGEGPSYSTISEQCITKCKASGKIGNLVKQSGPASPKPSSQKFECVCS